MQLGHVSDVKLVSPPKKEESMVEKVSVDGRKRGWIIGISRDCVVGRSRDGLLIDQRVC